MEVDATWIGTSKPSSVASWGFTTFPSQPLSFLPTLQETLGLRSHTNKHISGLQARPLLVFFSASWLWLRGKALPVTTRRAVLASCFDFSSDAPSMYTRERQTTIRSKEGAHDSFRMSC